MSDIIRIPPYQYIHVLDRNQNVTRVVEGPVTYNKLDNEKVMSSTPLKMIVMPPRTYCKITNPVQVDKSGQIVIDKYGQAKLHHGEDEYRFQKDYLEPFPLYPGEKVATQCTKLITINSVSALHLKAVRDFTRTVQGKPQQTLTGDEYLFKGPGTYYPRIEEKIVKEVKATIIDSFTAQKYRALQDLVDGEGNERRSGEEWIISKPGAYLPGVFEAHVEEITPVILTDTISLHLRALQNFTDVYNVKRKAGEEWLVTVENASTHIVDIYEVKVELAERTFLNANQWCIILDPYDPITRTNKLGSKIIRKGETSFFIYPGESLEGGINNIYILSEQQAALVKATENFVQRIIPEDRYEMIQATFKSKPDDLVLYQNERNSAVRVLLKSESSLVKEFEKPYKLKKGETLAKFVNDVERNAGDKWMEYGPANYLPPVSVQVIEIIKEIPLDLNEGVYIKDTRTGSVRSVIGRPYMLKAHEQLTEIDITPEFEKLLVEQSNEPTLNKTKVLTYRCPFNNACQIYDYHLKKSRIVLGPELVLLEPEEIITVNVLSGGKPKRKGVIKTLSINLGPDFTSDIIEVETSDHAKLSVKLAYNWHFDISKESTQEERNKIFAIQDFIGDMCTIMAAKIRSTVAQVSFETFHKSFAKLIRSSIFGVNELGKINSQYLIDKNNLVMTNVDIQQVEPIDAKTRKSLRETVSMAIDITTKSQEEEAKRKTEQIEQEARGHLERLKIDYDAKAENNKKKLLQFQNECKTIQNTGAANSEAKALSEANLIKAHAQVKISQLISDAKQAERTFKVETQKQVYKSRLDQEKEVNTFEIERKMKLADIETEKFEKIVQAIGQDTLVAISRSGVDTQVEMMKSLGLKGYMMTDGKTPINLFSAAGGLFGTNENTLR